MEQFNLIDNLNEKQLRQLHNLFNQVNWQRSDQDMRTLLGNSLSIALVESSTENLIGYARVLTDEVKYAFIFDVIVDKNYQKRGLGAMLMQAILSHQKLNKVKIFELTCPPFNEEFYKKFGFSEQYLSPEYGSVTPLRFTR